jgi:hypothetical protein
MLNLKNKIFEIQKEIGKMSKDKENPFFHSKYADLNQILDALNPLTEKKKILITQPLSNVNGRPSIRLVVEDLESDEIIVNEITMPDLQDSQKMGSASTYYRRYSLKSFFKLQDEDDDGNIASNTVKVKAKVKEMEKESPDIDLF